MFAFSFHYAFPLNQKTKLLAANTSQTSTPPPPAPKIAVVARLSPTKNVAVVFCPVLGNDTSVHSS